MAVGVAFILRERLLLQKESRGFGVVEERNGAPVTLLETGDGVNSDRTCLSRFRVFRFLFVATQRVRASTD